ncbi:glucose-6-phosphate 1-dehydrogenase [Geosporobacter subterraneus DSM 17957]|uniref:Glucose-6-phosphate 1-dehydrogenase n=1 Tax=Geosporobacter subterraneus DSM 17957 TaxID=1121919 RepID=A0A1M6F5C0_9FIRM|nr:glucose-6-phosphate dehydrogenase [Geosporobacter subterraneus]SHI92908.1 glucose-6-phosphate 1-dehydrogenase [Geosporobacter subterraneus DSM 17957]
MIINQSCSMIIFGGTGDLTHRKLIPALYHLMYQEMLPEGFAVISVGRQKKNNEEYREELYQSVLKYSRFPMDKTIWDQLCEKIYYRAFSFDEGDGYESLKADLQQMDQVHHTRGNRLYYLAVSPENFAPIVEKLKEHGVTAKRGCWQRVVIEKPFGQDLASAQQLNNRIGKVFSEQDTYRIDHYLGKEMIQNIMVIRFANTIFEPLWNHQYIDHIQITAAETEGVGSRGGYYEKAGALRDMVQNHLLQLLAITAMEPPGKNEAEAIRDEKVKILKAIHFPKDSIVHQHVALGQYRGYHMEEKVSPQSTTETYVALKLFLDCDRWKGVPFYIRTGKKLQQKTSQVVIQFKQPDKTFYKECESGCNPNLLVIKIQPEEGTLLQFNAKKPGNLQQILPVGMNFCQNCNLENNSPEAYEKLLLDVMDGDASRFTRWDEVENAWRLIDEISSSCEAALVEEYLPGGWGPEGAQQLIERSGHRWWNL